MPARLFMTFLGLFLLAHAEPALPAASSVKFTEVTRKVVRLGDHTITLIRVRPPVLPKALACLPPSPRPLTAEEKAYEDRVAHKSYATLNLSATVYVGGPMPVTELRWLDETGDIEYSAYSNVDFRYLTQLTQLETETTVYSWFPFLYECDLTDLPKTEKSPLPAGIDFSPTEPEYFIESGDADLKPEATTLAGLDYLHAYYQLHYAELKADYEQRETLAVAAEKALREHPPKAPNVTLRWWPVTADSSSR